jgi:hypothetical protein
VSRSHPDITVSLNKLDRVDVVLTADRVIEALLVLWDRSGVRLTVMLDPEDLGRIASECTSGRKRFDDEIDRRDAEGAA